MRIFLIHVFTNSTYETLFVFVEASSRMPLLDFARPELIFRRYVTNYSPTNIRNNYVLSLRCYDKPNC